ncbi:hypothetical protein QF038_001938 [Pseudarthrobacter sp. W1I19]|uniref:hypothetical protein n=1 Tax=Pseudarthrobacter sp. W1I19 TaxID=3042288 RepID=UPI00277D1E01|nr:hypothetical protein [Pseudarthrobacter sp. W1I19]MDQ0923430.1 hypothetical protein [Pseudarthrobacter sp. W1I19]
MVQIQLKSLLASAPEEIEAADTELAQIIAASGNRPLMLSSSLLKWSSDRKLTSSRILAGP